MAETKGKKCVLIVDDQPRVLMFIEINLKLRGYDVICAASGREALKAVNEAQPDIMLLDMIMPDMDGFEVLKALRGFMHLPVIAFSASLASREEALRLGADDFVLKPFDPDDMVKRIRALIG